MSFLFRDDLGYTASHAFVSRQLVVEYKTLEETEMKLFLYLSK
jgi:hypothetical protein